MMNISIFLLLFSFFGITWNSQGQDNVSNSNSFNLDRTLLSDIMSKNLTDGFDFPVGNKNGKGSYQSILDSKTYKGWYIATQFAEIYTEAKWIHTGEDWNGMGGGNTDYGQPIYSIATGEVVFSDNCGPLWGNVISIKHYYLENGRVKTNYSLYAHLEKNEVKIGERVKRRQQIGTIGRDPGKIYPAHLHLEIRKTSLKDYKPTFWPSSAGKSVKWVRENYESPSHFINQHRNLTMPYLEEKIVIAVKSSFKMYLYCKGKVNKTYEIALSQKPMGRKLKQGDLKVPEGEYLIIQLAKGPFGDNPWWFKYLGPRWIKLNYPNIYDAKRGVAQGLITKKQYKNIETAIKASSIPSQKTALGGGIGIHGWIEQDWENSSPRALTWGCISMHNNELKEFYNVIDKGTKIIILP